MTNIYVKILHSASLVYLCLLSTAVAIGQHTNFPVYPFDDQPKIVGTGGESWSGAGGFVRCRCDRCCLLPSETGYL